MTASEYGSAFSRRISPEVLQKSFTPINQRAQGMPGAGWHPRSRVQEREKDAHEHTGTAGASRHSLRDGFTAYVVLSRRRIPLASFADGLKAESKPGWSSQTSAGLTPATGARTTRFCRPHLAFVWRAVSLTESSPCEHAARRALPRPPLPAPYVRDDRDTPLLWDGMAGILLVIWATG